MPERIHLLYARMPKTVADAMEYISRKDIPGLRIRSVARAFNIYDRTVMTAPDGYAFAIASVGKQGDFAAFWKTCTACENNPILLMLVASRGLIRNRK